MWLPLLMKHTVTTKPTLVVCQRYDVKNTTRELRARYYWRLCSDIQWLQTESNGISVVRFLLPGFDTLFQWLLSKTLDPNLSKTRTITQRYSMWTFLKPGCVSPDWGRYVEQLGIARPTLDGRGKHLNGHVGYVGGRYFMIGDCAVATGRHFDGAETSAIRKR